MDIASCIKIGRTRKKMKQYELANLCGVSTNMVYLWESGKSIPTGDMLIKVAKELDIVDELFQREEIKSEDKEVDAMDEIRARLSEIEKHIGINQRKKNLEVCSV